MLRAIEVAGPGPSEDEAMAGSITGSADRRGPLLLAVAGGGVELWGVGRLVLAEAGPLPLGMGGRGTSVVVSFSAGADAAAVGLGAEAGAGASLGAGGGVVPSLRTGRPPPVAFRAPGGTYALGLRTTPEYFSSSSFVSPATAWPRSSAMCELDEVLDKISFARRSASRSRFL